MFGSWGGRTAGGKWRRPAARLRVEPLEGRAVPAVVGVGGCPVCGSGGCGHGVDVVEGAFTPEEYRAYEASLVADPNGGTPPPAAAGGPANTAAGGSVDRPDTVTIVLDFKDADDATSTDIFGNVVGAFDVTAFGFTAGQFDQLTTAIAAEVSDDFFGELAGTPAAPAGAGRDLAIEFVVGDVGALPANGAPEFYYMQVGTGISGSQATDARILGVAGLEAVRTAAGGDGFVSNGRVVGSVFTDHIRNIGNLTPANALTSGNLAFSTFAVSSTLSHEIGHTLSLSHVNSQGSVQPTPGRFPLMGTGAIDLPNQARIQDNQFSLSGSDGEAGGAARQQIQQLATALGLDGTARIAGAAFDDYDRDGSRDPGEPGLGGRTVFLDVNGNGSVDTFPQTTSRSSGTVNAAISPLDVTDPPDNVADVGAAFAPIFVEAEGTVTDVNVTVNVTDADVSDLVVYLEQVTPAGDLARRVFLTAGTQFGGPADGANLTNTTFDDEAAADLAPGGAPYIGSFRPILFGNPPNRLSLFDGLPALGTWFLVVEDQIAPFGPGAIASWSIQVQTAVPEPRATTAADGSYAFEGLIEGGYAVRQVAFPQFTLTDPSPAGLENATLTPGQRASGINFGQFDPARPAIVGVQVNGGSAQRSRLTSLTVTFDGPVDLAAGAFALTGTDPTGAAQPAVAVSVATQVVDGRTVVTLTFSGAGTEAGSLRDGTWRLVIDATRVTRNGNQLATNYASVDGAVRRLFGDGDGDGDVDAADVALFGGAYGKTAARPGYQAAFDADADGDVDGRDLLAFRRRQGTSLPG